MTEEVIHKRPAAIPGAPPNLDDYAHGCAEFSWERARAELYGLPAGGLNIAFGSLERHVVKGGGEKLALHRLGKDGGTRDFTYAELARRTNRFANVLAAAGIGKGDVMHSLPGRVYSDRQGQRHAAQAWLPCPGAQGF